MKSTSTYLAVVATEEVAAEVKKKAKKTIEQVEEQAPSVQQLAEPVSSITDTAAETVAASGVWDQFKNIDPANPSWDLFIILFFVVGALLYGISLGRDRIIVIMVSIFMALAVVEAMPEFVINVAFNGQSAFEVTTFISLFIILFFFISRSALLRTLGADLSAGRWYQTIIFSILHVGLLLSIIMSFMPAEILNKFTPAMQQIFTGEWPRFGWIMAPILAMVFFGSRPKEE